MTAEDTINAAKQGFEASFAEKNFYNRQTRDDEHLRAILDFLPIKPGMRILDLGTGIGYLAFALAETFPKISVTGLDIVDKTLASNREKATAEGIKNISFITYDGTALPFDDESFDLVVSRYALHHFPDIRSSTAEVFRVIKRGGSFFISDPAPDDRDKNGFIDEYMQVKKDGHIRFYTLDSWKDICGSCGFQLMDNFTSNIRFPRKNETAYREMISRHDKAVSQWYDINFSGDEVFITEKVNNILFSKN